MTGDREPGAAGRGYLGLGGRDVWAGLPPEKAHQGLRRMRVAIWLFAALPLGVMAVARLITSSSHVTVGLGVSFGVVSWLTAALLEIERRRWRKSLNKRH